ncbi:MAG TPA: NACHT domain-containing protein, partial [Pirellulales bacterium]|nr:NACHT domain-containing protein [Pirellulales bacterium]
MALTVGGELNRYREYVVREHEKLDFRGIGMPQLERQPIEDIFVDLTVRRAPTPKEECPIQRDDAVRCNDGEKSLAVPILSATECIASRDRVVVLGHPGSGKTTLLRFLAHRRAIETDMRDELPMYVRLAEFSRAQELDERVDLARFVAARAADRGCTDIEAALRKELADHRRRCLVLLDGLDEVGDHRQSEKLANAIRRFVEKYPQNRYVISSRVVGFEPGSWTTLGFNVFRVLGYGETQLRDFAEKFFRLLSRIKGQGEAGIREDLSTAIFSNPRVRSLASNPLNLTILVLLNAARGGTLPRRRVDLYAKVVDVFLDTWEASKHSADRFDETSNIGFDAREFRWLL